MVPAEDIAVLISVSLTPNFFEPSDGFVAGGGDGFEVGTCKGGLEIVFIWNGGDGSFALNSDGAGGSGLGPGLPGEGHGGDNGEQEDRERAPAEAELQGGLVGWGW